MASHKRASTAVHQRQLRMSKVPAFIHVPVTALNDETFTSESLYQLVKILMCLFLGQKEEESQRSQLQQR